jgi:hypothetical protein
VATKWIRRAAAGAMAVSAMLTAGCGDLAQVGRSPVQLVILSMQGASGAEPDDMGSFVLSDVLTLVTRSVNGEDVSVPTIFNDIGQVTMQVVLKDQGVPGLGAEPGPLNAVTITRYRVAYRRADGRNTPGVDVPFGFEGAVTFTVPNEGSSSSGFELVRVIAKQETPLRPLAANGNFITTLADITFFGRDLAGNDIQATGSIQVDFGNFADPE